MAYQEKQLQDISKKFQIYGEILHAETFKIGHINETYSATYSQGGTRVRYIHQKINRTVFKNPGAVMKNVMRVTGHLRKKLEQRNARDLTRRSLVVIPTRDGKSYYLNGKGEEVWRTFVFIEGVETFRSGAVAATGIRGRAGIRRVPEPARGPAGGAIERNDPGFS